ncbi:GRIP and coiled-coil domain-containing protein 2-like isoform X2 [Varroa jacobsoni]|uniref:GRIP domain-containing protein n=1 Tax=Varroa destructor TaxID=109461 RepID=A0A7M7JH77_VARDE|nr:GRIP and coiled-coil domain-containing protein 2-like isoform X2 [Varroa destructor]XP_022651752.1 GRIP and coiled-coil domain-containing protein 2-like isoform X2 [Varroa destructor]XP_022700479.1 GRIP and coiled-coil domain-containing protein 2-like isoform X2 [Varroa jacobsoni]
MNMSDQDVAGSSKQAIPLEEQDYDGLLQYCKRQFLLLQKTKAKFDEQKKERENAESQLRAQLEEISEERDKLRTKLEEDRNQQAQHIEELEARNASLENELKQIGDTSSSGKKDPVDELSEATNELNLLREEKRELLEKLDSLESARDAALELEKRMAQALDDNRSLRSQLDEALEMLKALPASDGTFSSEGVSVIKENHSERNELTLKDDAKKLLEEVELPDKLKEVNDKLLQAEEQLKQMEDEKMEWQARETATRCRVEELESNVQVLTADLDNDRQHICTLTEALETAERAETNAKNSLQRLQSRVDELISSLAISCGIIFSTSDQQIERFSRLCLDTLLALVELSPPTPLLFDELSTGLKAISDDFVRCDQRKVEAQESLREAIVKLNDALDEADTLRAEVDSVRCALEAEKKLREEVERRSLEAADECDILRSTTTALTNQLEEAQVHLSQLLMDGEAADNGHEPEVNSTDDDKNSSDDARVGQQISAFREQINSLQVELERERSLREAAERDSCSLTAELTKAQEAASDIAKMTSDTSKEKEAELQRLLMDLKNSQDQVETLTKEVSQERIHVQVLKQQIEEKSDLLERFRDTADNMVERINSDTFSNPDDGCSVFHCLLRNLEDLVKDFSKAPDVENKIADMKVSENSERYMRNILQCLLNTVRTLETQNNPSESVKKQDNILLIQTSSLPDQNGNGELPCESTIISVKDAEIQERDEKIVKLKSLLVKMKKEHAALKKELVALKSSQQQPAPNILANNIQSLQTEYDKAVDDLEAERKLSRELQKKIAQTVDRVAEMELISSQLENDKRQLLAKVEQVEHSAEDAAHAKAEAEAQVLVVTNELEKARTEMDRLRQELSQQIQNVTGLQVEMSVLQQQVELGRSAIDEAQQVSERSKRLEQEAREARDQLETLVTSKAHLELRLADAERRAAEVEQLRNCYDQLSDAKSELAIRVTDAMRRLEESESKAAELASQLADEEQALKVSQLQVAEKVQEVQELQNLLQSQKDSQTRLVRTLESKAASLKRDYATVKLELDESKKEFEAYKIKAHSMIRIKEKPERKNELIDNSIITSLKLKIDELTQELSVSKTELEATQEQLSRLQDRYDSLQKDIGQRNQEFKIKLAMVLEEREKKVREEMLRQETSKLEEAVARHKDELMRKEQAQKTMVQILEDKLVEMRTELEAIRELNRTREMADRSPDLHNVSGNDVFLEPVRQPGEGSDCTDTAITVRPLPFDVIPTSGFQPLDKLLEHQEVPSFETFESVTSRLEEAMKRIDHFTELLNESEVNNLRLSEQVRVLKEEVRRLERNKERDEQFGNLEYLKNVVLKYLTMRSERERLVPVLVTMLKLSPDEKRTLQQGEQGWGLLPKFL